MEQESPKIETEAQNQEVKAPVFSTQQLALLRVIYEADKHREFRRKCFQSTYGQKHKLRMKRNGHRA